MKMFLALIAMVSNLDAANYFCPDADKEFVQQLVNRDTNTPHFLGSWDSPEERSIIERTIKNFPKDTLKPKQDSSNKAVCLYTSNSGAFFTLNCPQLTGEDIQNIYNGKEEPLLSLDENSKEELKLFFNALETNNGEIASVMFQQNTYQSVPNSCLYNVVSTQTREGTFSAGANVVLSPRR